MPPLTYSKIIKRYHSGSEFTVEEIVRLIDRPEAGICVIICVHAETERLIVPQRSRSPV